MKGKRKSGQRILTALLCLTLCAADIMGGGMTAWASEQMPQSSVPDGNESGITGEDDNDNSTGDSESGPQEQESEADPEDTDADEDEGNNGDPEQNDSDDDENSNEENPDVDKEDGDLDSEDEREDNEDQDGLGHDNNVQALQTAATGDIFEIDYVIYEVISEADHTVRLKGIDRDGFNRDPSYGGWSAADLTIPASVDSDGVSYKVTEIGEFALADYMYDEWSTPSDEYGVDQSMGGTLQIAKVIVSPGITKIGKGAFYKSSRINEIILPDTIEEIGEAAFYFYEMSRNNNGYFSPLTVNIPKSVKTIEKYAYHGVHFDNEILKIPSGVETIGDYAFACASDSSGIYGVEIPESAKIIGYYAFDIATLSEAALFRTDMPFRTNSNLNSCYEQKLFGDVHENSLLNKELTLYVPEALMGTYEIYLSYYRPNLNIRNINDYSGIAKSPIRFLYNDKEIERLELPVSDPDMPIGKTIVVDEGDGDFEFNDIRWSFMRYGTDVELTEDELESYLTYTINNTERTIRFTGVEAGVVITVAANVDGYLPKSFDIRIIEGYTNEGFLEMVSNLSLEDIERMRQITYADEIDYQLNAIRSKAQEITADCSSDYDKIKAVHTWLADNIAYDYDHFEGKERATAFAHMPYGVLTYRYGVCGGYAGLARDMLRSIGIPCAYIGGNASGDFYNNTFSGHAWNMAYDKAGDRWIYFDPTWDAIGFVRDNYIGSYSTVGARTLSWFDFDVNRAMAEGREFRDVELGEINKEATFVKESVITLFPGEEADFIKLYDDVAFRLQEGWDVIELDTATGHIKALKPGSAANILASRPAGYYPGSDQIRYEYETIAVRVLEKEPLEFETAELTVGMADEEEYLKVNCLLNGNYVNPYVEMKSDNPGVLTVGQDGTLSVKSTGTATVTAGLFISASKVQYEASCTITVVDGKTTGNDGKFMYRILSEPSGNQNGTVEIIDSMLGKRNQLGTNLIEKLEIPASTELAGKSYDVIGIGKEGLAKHWEFDDVMAWVTEIVLPDTLQYIGASAFEGGRALKYVQIPLTVKSIGDYAFKDTGLTGTIDISGVSSIGQGIFSSCSGIETVILSDDLDEIPDGTFDYENNLKHVLSKSRLDELGGIDRIQEDAVLLSDKITRIGERAFSGCRYIQSVDAVGAKELGKEVFSNCDKLETVTLSDELTVIPDRAFRNCGVFDGFDFGDNIESIGAEAFAGCINLGRSAGGAIELGNRIKTIGDGAFRYCSSISAVTIYSKVIESIGANCFSSNPILYVYKLTPDIYEEKLGDCVSKIIYISVSNGITWTIDNNGKLTVKGSGDFERSGNMPPWHDDASSIKSAVIDVTDMTNASYMFYGCSELTYLDLSGFDTGAVTDMSCMFKDCKSLTEADLSRFDTGKVKSMSFMFDGCSSLTKLDLSGWSNDAVTDMSRMFQSCTSLKELNLSDFKTTNVTTMEGMFLACHKLTKLDVSSFDTGKVENMYAMFGCESLTELDVSGFDTGNVTDMSHMFSDCESLTELDVSGFDTGKVTDMNRMFYDCQSLTELDVSNFDTSNVTDMSLMFYFCLDLEELTLDGDKWDTGNVTDMSYMFYCCESLKDLNLSRFDTGEVTNMERMFCECKSLTLLDVNSLDTSNVTNMELMFAYCESLTELDLSGFDTSKVTNADRMFDSSKKLEVIYAPLHLAESVKVTLPKAKSGDVWYRADTGQKETQLPQSLTKSILLTKNKKVVISEPYISAVKDKTVYAVGDVLNTDDIIVTYCSIGGAITKLTEGFNVDKAVIDMSVPGKKELVITYVDPYTKTGENPDGIELKTTIELTVTLGLTGENTTINPIESVVYSGYQQRPVPIVTVRTDGTGVSTTLSEGTDYEVTYDNNTNVGTATVTITGIGDIYSGTVSESFIINRKLLTVKVKDMNLTKGEQLPKEFDYEIDGIVPIDMPTKEDEFPVEISYSFENAGGGTVEPENISEADVGSVYYVIPNVGFTDTNYGANYEVNTVKTDTRGKLTITAERVVYKVVFDMMGHGDDITDVTIAGSLITEPIVPEAEGYVFSGWYKDKTFAAKQKWNFTADTVQADTTLYACWIAKGTEGYSGLQFSIQDIRDQYYTGSAIKPTVYVYTADGETLLKSGKDYTIKYVNNTNAVEVDEERGEPTVPGGTAWVTTITNEAGKRETQVISFTGTAFDDTLPYVIITGKGNYSGVIYKNFRILPAEISTEDGNGNTVPAAGFTLKYSDQLVTNAKKDQNPFSSLKYKKAMKVGTDFTVTLRAVDAYDAEGKAALDEEGKAWSGQTEYVEKTKKYTMPVIPKGYYGTFAMEVKGVGNYRGSFTKDIVVTDKDHLMKNASVSLGKNQKSRAYMNGWEVTLTPGYMVMNGKVKEYYVAGKPEMYTNANDIFMVSVKDGKTTKYLRADEEDFTVSYTNNKAVGTATMTVIGNPDRGYYGSKSVTFKITGTAFNTKNVIVRTYDAKKSEEENARCFMTSMAYAGRAITQNNVVLTPKQTIDNPNPSPLVYGIHYTISYKNNVRKGTATMTFTAKPESGYTGSFKKTFKIEATDITNFTPNKDIITKQKIVTGEDPTEGWKVNEAVAYVKGGVKLSDIDGIDMNKILVNKEGINLTMGTDYTVKYKNNTAVTTAETGFSKMPCMTITGKGNYKGTLTVYFDIKKAQISAEQITVSQIAWNEKAKGTYEYKPSVKVVDSVSGKALSAGTNKDYSIEYINSGQENVTNYINGEADETPMVVITVPDASSYQISETGSVESEDGTKVIKKPLPIYETKLTSSNLYVIVSEESNQITYTGCTGTDKKISPTTPTVVVYCGDAKDIKKAKAAKETGEAILTNKEEDGVYKLTKLEESILLTDDGDYTVTYGANNKAGKNNGSVTITGVPRKYGRSVTVKFTIQQRNVYYTP